MEVAMKLSEFRKIIDQLDDEAREYNEDDSIVLDITKDDDTEVKVGIGEIFKSRLSKNTVKIEPEEEIKPARPPRYMKRDRDLVVKQTSYYCPTCGRKVEKYDRFCKHCGQEMIVETANKPKYRMFGRKKPLARIEKHEAGKKDGAFGLHLSLGRKKKK